MTQSVAERVRCRPLNGRQKKRVRKLHARGLKDGEIAAALGVDRQAIWRIRRQENLPSNFVGEARREILVRSAKKKFRHLGVRTMNELNLLTLRVRAAAAGWPYAGVGARALQVLEVLDEAQRLGKTLLTREVAMTCGMKFQAACLRLWEMRKHGLIDRTFTKGRRARRIAHWFLKVKKAM